jgi:hypothetical protein
LDELVARINAGGVKEARGGLQATGPGVFLSFIATIFIDDVLQSLHHPYCDNPPRKIPYYRLKQIHFGH